MNAKGSCSKAYQEQLGYPDMNRYTDTANTEMVNGWFHF